jgi:hypothetical protein
MEINTVLKHLKIITKLNSSSRWIAAVTLGLTLSACNVEEIKSVFVKKKQSEYPLVDSRRFADALYQMALASRNAYAKNVVTPLAIQRNIVSASENWKELHALPLPAQFARYTAEGFGANSLGVTLQLQSLWPINAANQPTSPVVIEGLKAVSTAPNKPYYAIEKLGNEETFVAVYADRASTMACILCHNEHPNSPRHDLSGEDILGGFVVRLTLQKQG